MLMMCSAMLHPLLWQIRPNFRPFCRQIWSRAAIGGYCSCMIKIIVRVKGDPSMAQTIRLKLTEDMDSVETARFCLPRSTYFSLGSCHITIDHHDMPHSTSHTRPSHFSACNIEKLGMGLGKRLAEIIYTYESDIAILLVIW